MFQTVFDKGQQFLVIGYSFGSLLALEIVKRLESRSLRGKLMMIDGSPMYLQRFAGPHLVGADDEHLQMAILTLVVGFALPTDSSDAIKLIMAETTYDNRVSKMLELGRNENSFSEDYTRKMMRVLFYRLKAAMNLSSEAKEKLLSQMVLVRSTVINDIEEDYGLSDFTQSSLIVKVIDGTHQTMLSNAELIEIINKDTLEVDLVDEKEDRWRHIIADIPKRLGKLNNLDKFDAEYFGYSFKDSHVMDPQHRLLLEHCLEVVLDAGLHLDDLRGTNTGIFVGVSMVETETYWTCRKELPNINSLMSGYTRNMLAFKVAHALDLKGPAMAVDTACSSSLYALDLACKAIRNGQCDSAIVAGTNLTLHPYITLQFALLGVLAADGYCRPFDKCASGYSRSEANAVILLQKAKDAKRIYAHVVNTKTNCDGYKLEGITFPSNKIQKQLLDELYAEVPYDPKDICYVEAHSTGTVVGDPEECDAIEKVFCPDRTEPLLVGSVKSNIGHSEAAAGICSLTKCIIAMQTNVIPPNINYTEPRTDVPSLLNGKLKVVDNPTPLTGPLVAVNSFGFGGANAHALLHSSMKKKLNGGFPTDGLPRLVVWNGRTMEAVDVFLESLKNQTFDAELYALVHNISRKPVAKMNFRGFAIYMGRSDGSTEIVQKNIVQVRKQFPKVVIVFGQLDYDWKTTLHIFEKFPTFKATLKQCVNLLEEFEFDTMFNKDSNTNTLHRVVWTLIIQIGVYHTLKSIGLKMDLYGGYSVGQITCAYIDGVLSLHDAIRMGFAHGALLASYNNPETFNYREIVTNDDEFISDAINCLSDQGFILLRESLGYTIKEGHRRLQLVSTITLEDETFFLLQQKKSAMNASVDAHAIKVSMEDTTIPWLLELKQEVKTTPLILYAQNDASSGIIGLVNCLRKEPNIQPVTCFFIDDPNAPSFDPSNPFYKDQIDLGLAVNVYRNGQWGMYRHFKLLEPMRYEPTAGHCYGSCLKSGDLSSLTWMLGPISERPPIGPLIRVAYSSLNFKDVMIATGRLSTETYDSSRLDQDYILGFEYSGVTAAGKRVMGICSLGSLSTLVEADPLFTLDVPDEITLEQAASIPTVYATVYTAFFICSHIRKGNSILIHAGTGGIGIAAIRVCLAYGLEIFTTVSTKEKREFLLSYFPDLKPENIGNSRDTTFENLIKLRTNGRGVDFVLNSLSEEKLQASVRCLAKGGHFLEIGKYDMMKDSKLAMTLFQKGISFTAVLVDLMFKEKRELMENLHKLIMSDLSRGIIQPLPTTAFQAHEMEQAFRYLATAKHIEQSFVIAGGLGGFGLELADWLIIRGCRKLLLSSSRGISKPYQQYRIRLWESYGVQVRISTEDISTSQGCRRLLQQASDMGPVAGIYNLAVQLRDAIIENQSVDKFVECLAPKANATSHLDVISRKLCPMLKHFVVFSSVSCGRGNAGQSNYGMANSIMERIIERRVADGLPGKAIQWGAIGEVGIVADMQEDRIDMEIGGTLQQRLSSCIQVLDQLLTSNEPIVASMVVAEKRSSSGGAKNIIEAVMNIMNIRDMKSVSVESTLADIGMDSLMAVEIRQVLERDFDIILTPQDLRTLTFSKLQKLADAKAENEAEESLVKQLELEDLLASFGDEAASHQTILRLPSKSNEVKYDLAVLIIPGIESVCSPVWTKIASQINAPTFILQTFDKASDEQTIPGIVDSVFDEMFQTVFDKGQQFLVIGYSFGSLLALEIVKRLESRSLRGKLMMIDGSPIALRVLI
ncbi:hypothetical protein AND_000128 [Anopheles darlingi]|uniref:Fatty acid synthase n=1 Tax=Anopheles darlingi TaxID=43151 RepID=W5JUK7_ANODA|nr:hypothetical protein AND_000128 [Anopheles darlingi]